LSDLLETAIDDLKAVTKLVDQQIGGERSVE
jgi:hypothetical protein